MREGTHMPQHTCGVRRTALWSLFSPASLVGPRDWTQAGRRCRQKLYPLSHPAHPRDNFAKLKKPWGWWPYPFSAMCFTEKGVCVSNSTLSVVPQHCLNNTINNYSQFLFSFSKFHFICFVCECVLHLSSGGRGMTWWSQLSSSSMWALETRQVVRLCSRHLYHGDISWPSYSQC